MTMTRLELSSKLKQSLAEDRGIIYTQQPDDTFTADFVWADNYQTAQRHRGMNGGEPQGVTASFFNSLDPGLYCIIPHPEDEDRIEECFWLDEEGVKVI